MANATSSSKTLLTQIHHAIECSHHCMPAKLSSVTAFLHLPCTCSQEVPVVVLKQRASSLNWILKMLGSVSVQVLPSKHQLLQHDHQTGLTFSFSVPITMQLWSGFPGRKHFLSPVKMTIYLCLNIKSHHSHVVLPMNSQWFSLLILFSALCCTA